MQAAARRRRAARHACARAPAAAAGRAGLGCVADCVCRCSGNSCPFLPAYTAWPFRPARFFPLNLPWICVRQHGCTPCCSMRHLLTPKKFRRSRPTRTDFCPTFPPTSQPRASSSLPPASFLQFLQSKRFVTGPTLDEVLLHTVQGGGGKREERGLQHAPRGLQHTCVVQTP